MALNFCSGVGPLNIATCWVEWRISSLFPAEISPLPDMWLKKLAIHTKPISGSWSSYSCHSPALTMPLFNSTYSKLPGRKRKRREGGRERKKRCCLSQFLSGRHQDLTKRMSSRDRILKKTKHKIIIQDLQDD